VRNWKVGRVTETGSEVLISRCRATVNFDQYGTLRDDTRDVRRVNYPCTIEG
jgi:hypothetical protein